MLGIAQMNLKHKGASELGEKTLLRVEGIVQVHQRDKWSSEANTLARGDEAKEQGDGRVRSKFLREKNTEGDGENTLRGAEEHEQERRGKG